MGNLVEVVAVDTTPTEDVYSHGSKTYSQLWINPEKQECGVSQETYRAGTPMEEYLDYILTYNIDAENDRRYNEEELEEFLNSEMAQELLGRVCTGWFTEWDGRNLRGHLNEDADSAIDDLLRGISDEVEEKELWATWYAEEWLMTPSDAGVFAWMSDEELDSLEDEYLAQAKDEEIVILDSILDVLTTWRDEELESWIDRAIEFGSSRWDEEFTTSHHWFDKTTLEVKIDFGDDILGIVHVTKTNESLVFDPFEN